MDYLPRILELLRRKDYIPLPVDRIAERLEVPSAELSAFRREVSQHLRHGTLVKLKKNRVCLPRDADLVTGVIRFRQSGSALLIPDVPGNEAAADSVLIKAEDTQVAMHGDRVVARINQTRPARYRKGRKAPPSPADDQKTARVIRILERARTTLTGTLQKSRMFHFVIPDEPRIVQDILVPDPAQSPLSPKPRLNDKVVVRLLEWEHRHLNPEGEIIEVLGKTHHPLSEYKALLHQYGLNPDFPDTVMAEVDRIPAKVAKRDLKHREDIRKTYTMTIDPQDAKDFDDAITWEKKDNGEIEIGVHIADVSAYVKLGSALDREARARGNSTYLVGTVIPMLPHALSNGICSLVENEDRLTKSVFLRFSPRGKLLGSRFANTVIRSNKRLSYEQAYALLFNDNLDEVAALPAPPAHQTGSTGRPLSELSRKELANIQFLLRKVWALAEKLRSRRMARGSLDLDMPETKIFVDEEGYADRIVKVEHDQSHQLIEELMLAANEAVARHLNERDLPAIHRVHDKPDQEKLDEFGDYLAAIGITTGDLSVRKNVTAMLSRIRHHPQSYVLRLQFLRSLKSACYRASPDGHYGLAKQHYTHFTSPIRRYSDLVVHRIFEAYLAPLGPGGTDKKHLSASALSSIAQHLSITEQNSTDAERESNKIKLLEYFEREVGKKKKSVFDAVIVDIKNHGMFVELTDSMAYGLIHVSTMLDDLYSVSNDGSELVGRKQKQRFRVGDKIPVSVHRVDRFKRQIDFALSDKEKR